MIEEWSLLLYNLFVNDIFGSKLLFSAFILFFFGAFAFKMRMSFDAFMVSAIALIVFLAGFSMGIPIWVIAIIAMILGLIIGLGVLRVARR